MSSGSVIGTRNWHKDIRNYWSSDKHTDLPILTHNVEAVKFANSTSTRFLTSRSFLTLSNARISYDLPKSLMKHLGLTVPPSTSAVTTSSSSPLVRATLL